MPASEKRTTTWGVILISIGGGILVPLAGEFADGALRSALQPALAQPYLTVASFTLLFTIYFAGYELLWKWLLERYRFDNPFYLLRLGTLGVIAAFTVHFAQHFQPENLFSNLVWLLFFTVAAAFFYLIGRMRINRF